MSTQDRKIDWLKPLLRGVIRFCLRHNIVLQELTEASKELFLQMAREELESQGQKVTTSRLTAMTGVHRRDVKRLSDAAAEKVVREPISMPARVLGQWEQDKAFQSKDETPKALTYKGEDNEFRQLVSKVSNDLNPATILFELVRIGAVEKRNDLVMLKDEALSVSENADEAFMLLGRDVEDLMSGVSQNVGMANEIPNLHARTEYDNIYIEDLPEIRKWLLEQGSRFHRRVRNYLAEYDKDITGDLKKTGGGRVTVGAFALTMDCKDSGDETDENA